MSRSPRDKLGMLARLARVAGKAEPSGAPSDFQTRGDSRLDTIATAGDGAAKESSEALREMIERKRRNDTVRKRELDMLRRIRHEGLSPEQAALLVTSSRLDDNDSRPPLASASTQSSMKAKIDAIERQMVGSSTWAKAPLLGGQRGAAAGDGASAPPVTTSGRFATSRGARLSGRVPLSSPRSLPPTAATGPVDAPPPAASPPSAQVGVPTLPVLPQSLAPSGWQRERTRPSHSPHPTAPAYPESAAMPHSPRPDGPRPVTLAPVSVTPSGWDRDASGMPASPWDGAFDDAVMSFAAGQFEQAQQQLNELIQPGGGFHDDRQPWLLLADLYRATGQQSAFEAVAEGYAAHFRTSPPQWVSLPKLVAQAQAPMAAQSLPPGQVPHWRSPGVLTAAAVASLPPILANKPQPWLLDWTVLHSVNEDAADVLAQQLEAWGDDPANQQQWIGSERLLAIAADATPALHRAAPQSLWLLRLAVLRLLARATEFDDVALDFAATYEVSPPSWRPPKARVRDVADSQEVQATLPPHDPEASTADAPAYSVADLSLWGHLAGDVSGTLARLEREAGGAPHWRIDCARLIRVDFVAAGDLLNWVSAHREAGFSLHFADLHRLVARLMQSMGIEDHAKLSVRTD